MEAPDVAWLAVQHSGEAAVVVALGVWERQPAGWRRVGGHYATLAGVGLSTGAIALADPLADMVVETGNGRTVPADPSLHSCRTAPRAHDDASIVAHDAFFLSHEPALPHGGAVLTGYFTSDNQGEAAAFQGQNPMHDLAGYRADWLRGSVVMAIDAAVAISVPPGTVATATAWPPSATPTTAPSSTPTRVPTRATEGATPSATVTAPDEGWTAALPLVMSWTDRVGER
jgi:hypothetical protein